MVKKLFRDLLARSFGPEAGGVIGGKEILHVPRRLHERVERSRAFAREDDRARQHPIWQRTASTAKTTPTVGGEKKKMKAPEFTAMLIFTVHSANKRARQTTYLL